jgi:hypothetical protein
MLFYRYIDIENFDKIQEEITKFLFTKTTVLKEKLPWKFINVSELSKENPTLIDYFRNLGLDVNVAAAVYRRPYSQGGIHVDTSMFWRVLLPVLNCQGSRTKFFEFDSSKFKQGSGWDGDRNLSLIPGHHLKFLDEFELARPVIFNPKIPHGVYCNSKLNGPRISLTLGFDKDPKNI